MIDLWVNWWKSLTMEQTFIVTGIGILAISIPLGFLGEWIFRKENERKDKEDV